MRSFLVGLLSGVLLSVVVALCVLVGIGHWLAVADEPLQKADVIVAVSGDTGPRTATAVALWKQGWAPLVLFAGASLDPDSVSSAELMKREAVRLGVPADRVLIEPASTTTDENARLVAQLMSAQGPRSAILVTSPYHQRRASMLFSRAFAPAGLSFRNHPANDPEWDADRWWLHAPTRRITVIELAKIGAVIFGGA